MTRHLTWTCPDCGEICECTDAACECQLEAEDRESACTCRWSTINSASIDPPHKIPDKWCPVHGLDPDEEYERRRDDD
jgi:hypothetical protein